uniref:PID domain-containing protein n=1 Tax=Lates calcarifer TaxID=8187 RepID=A0A4W6DC73_LATCA
MSDTSEDDNEISFRVKFLGRVEVVRPDGLQILDEAAQSLKTADKYSPRKGSQEEQSSSLPVSEWDRHFGKQNQVFVVYMPTLHCFLLCRPVILTQSLWLCGQTPCSRHVPLLSVPEQEVFSCAGVTYWGRLPNIEKGGEHQGRTGPDCGGAQT